MARTGSVLMNGPGTWSSCRSRRASGPAAPCRIPRHHCLDPTASTRAHTRCHTVACDTPRARAAYRFRDASSSGAAIRVCAVLVPVTVHVGDAERHRRLGHIAQQPREIRLMLLAGDTQPGLGDEITERDRVGNCAACPASTAATSPVTRSSAVLSTIMWCTRISATHWPVPGSPAV